MNICKVTTKPKSYREEKVLTQKFKYLIGLEYYNYFFLLTQHLIIIVIKKKKKKTVIIINMEMSVLALSRDICDIVTM